MTMGNPDQPSKITYATYLRVPQLLELQRRLSVPAHHDEMLFIISHQVYELWFKQALHELDRVCYSLDRDNALRAGWVFERLHRILHLLIEQIPLLETMSAVDFAQFRDNLRPASGFQSIQFRKLEFRCGFKNERMMGLAGDDERVRAELEAIYRAPTVYDHLLGHLDRAGFKMPREVLERDTSKPHQPDERVVAAMSEIYKQPEKHYPQFRALEHFLEFDERFSIWRFHHVKMVERMIGGKTGTGGSSGAKYLATTLSIKFFPEIWMVRDGIGAGYGAP